jgi:preprotein translocase subunit YajC
MEKYSQYIFIVAIIAAFYFLIIRPQRKRQQDQASLLSSLVPGAEIMTIGGLYGTIVSIDDDRVRIVVADGTEMVFAKNAIARTVKPEEPAADELDEADEDAESSGIVSDAADESDSDAEDAAAAPDADDASAAGEPADDVHTDSKGADV